MAYSKITLNLAASLALVGCGSAPQVDPSDPLAAAVAERQANFKDIKKANDAMKAEVEAEAPDVAVFQTNAAALLAHVEPIKDLFPEGSGVNSGYDTEALPLIWQDRPAFDRAADDMVAAGQVFAQVAEAGDIAAITAGLDELGQSCRACHRQFRQQD